MSFAASAAIVGPNLYVYYYSSANTTAPLGSLFAYTAPNATSNTLLYTGQSLINSGPNPVKSPTSAWMFPNSKNQLILLLSQSSPTILSLQPQSQPQPLVNQVPWNETGINNVNWAVTDLSSVSGLVPAGLSQPQISIASGNSGTSEGSGMYELYSALVQTASQLYITKLDISNGGAGVISLWPRSIGNIDPTSSPRVVRLPGTSTMGVDVVAVGGCPPTNSSNPGGTCLNFFVDGTFGNAVSSA
ncbi:hypothetical protein EMPS_06532 [Entomortierella parvispora]|uniref:Uncharacterized protein n=1 Tax=Entomortierella parvispora TaxID=205924 RepID=A0A9P3HCI9_9FUNG|nr:hypothetical protein EMPS_06532 [Entomortierella parvispora]